MWRLLLGLLLYSSFALPDDNRNAKIVGNSYLGIPGTRLDIELNGVNCVLESSGNVELKEFTITLTCNGMKQLLWHDGLADVEIDEPRFQLLWAGDQDKDGKLDLKMEVSPKYSCKQEANFNSSQARTDQLVGDGILNCIECD